MPRLLQESEIDPVNEQVDAVLTAEEEKGIPWLNPDKKTPAPDLTDGGMVNGVRVTPYSGWGGTKLERGRPVARQAWDVFGTSSLLALKWNPDGDIHDGARSYLQKRHCTCCHYAGFRIRRGQVGCPQCAKNNCSRCSGGTVRGNIIPQFYLREADVPFPVKKYGPVDCFLPLCPRRDGVGFKTEQDMRIHARSKHRLEYQALQEVEAATRTDETAYLREELASLRRRLDSQPVVAATVAEPPKARRRRKRQST